MTIDRGTLERGNEPIEEQEERYAIRSDAEADRWLEKVREARVERDRLVSACKERIEEFNARIKAAENNCESETGYVLGLLFEYFATVPRKKTKTQESYALPSGKLVLKTASVAPRADDEKLLRWAQENAPEYVQTISKTRWSELKKALVLKDDHYIFVETGEIVDGLTPEEQPEKFEVK